MSKGGGGSTTRHIIEVMYQVTGLDKAGAGITSMNKSVTQGQTTLDKYGMSANKAAQETTKLGTAVKPVAPSIDKTAVSTEKLSKSQDKAGKSAKGLAGFFQGNKGLIFSTTMLSSGVFEAIGMFQGWTDASERLGEAQQKVADLEARGMENTKDYGDAVREAADAQRGYNFITRFTIQSFADLIPMSLMMTSSLIDLSGNFMKGASMKEKFAAASGKVVTGLKSVGSAMMTFTTRHPLLLLLTLLATAVVAVITNFGGFRDRLNEVGAALGNAVPGLKGFLTWLGELGNGFFKSAEASMGYSETTTKSLKDVESEVLRTGDATSLSIDEQIAMFGKLGDESENVAFSLGMHLKMQQDEQEAHKTKYAQFVEALQSGDQDIIQSMGLTEEEFKEFYKEWEEEIKSFDENFSAHVDTIVENYKKFGESTRELQETQGEELEKLNKKLMDHQLKKEEIMDKDKKGRKEALEDWQKDNDEIIADIQKISDGLSNMAIDAREDWVAFSTAGKEAMDKFKLEAVGGNFKDAVNAITTAMDNVPDKYKQNMGMAKSILENDSLSMESRADIFVAHMDKLNPFQSFIVGAHEYTLAQAQVTSGLDELAVAARSGITDVDQMDGAWKKFVASLSPAQKELPIVKSAIEGVETNSIKAATAFGMVEAAGRLMSEQLKGTVTKSFEDLEKVIVEMPDGTNHAFASIGGQIVDLGKVSDQDLVSGPGSMVKNMEKTETQAATLATTMETEMPKSSSAVETFTTDANSFLNGIITTFTNIGTEAAKIPGQLKTALSAETIKTAWDEFRNALGETGDWINQGVTKIASYLKGAITIENFKDAWTGFWQAIAEGGTILVSGIATLATTIANDIKAKAMSQQWWKGFWDAMSSTLTWVGTGIVAIGAEIAKQITVPNALKWWKGFQDALGSTAQWVGTGIKNIGTGITKTITSEGPKWWAGFQDALGSTAQWVGTGITRIGQGIAKTIVSQGPSWWKGFQDALGASVDWVGKQIAKVAQAILDYPWLEVGKGIMQKIGEGLASLGKGGMDWLKQLNPMEFGGKDQNPFTPIGMNGNGPRIGGDGQIGQNTLDIMKGLQGQGGAAGGGGMFAGIIQEIQTLQQALSTLSTSVATYSKSMTTNLGAFFTKVGAAIPMLDGMIKTHQATWSAFSTSLLAYSTSMTANLGTFFTTIAQALTLLDQGVKMHQTSWATFSTSLLAYSTSMTANLGTFFTTIVQALGLLDQGVKLHHATWSAFSTSLTTYSASMTANLGKFFTTIAQALGLLDQGVKLHQKTWSTLSTSVATYSNSMKTNVNSFATAAKSSLTTLGSAVTKTQGQMSTFSKSVATYSNSMKSNLKSFSSSAVSSLNAVASAAKKATSALKAMASAAAKAKAARSGLRFGGAFVTGGQLMNQSSYAQTGKSWINSRPRRIGGVNISEFSKPELVTVTPLSNPNDPMDKGLNYLDKLPAPKLQIPTTATTGTGGGAGGRNNQQPINVQLHTTITMPDGKVLARAVQEHLLSGFSGIT
jgi:hypothetical protein